MQGKSIIRNAPMLTAKGRRKLAQYLDNQAKAMKTYEEAGEIAYKSIKAIEKAKKLVGKPFRTTVANLSKINKGFGPKIGPRLKKLYKRMGMGADQKFIKQIKRDMDIGFIKRASQNSDIGYSLWRTSGKSKAQLNDEFMNFARGVQQRNPKDWAANFPIDISKVKQINFDDIPNYLKKMEAIEKNIGFMGKRSSC